MVNQEDNNFEREEMARLMEALKRYEDSKGQASYFTEEEYEFIVDHYLDNDKGDLALKAASDGFMQFPFSSSLLVKYCDSLVLQRQYDNALEVLDGYAPSFPLNSDICLSYSRIYIYMGNLALARKYYDKAMAIETSPEDICDSIHALAQDCIENEAYKEALFYLSKSRELTLLWDSKHNEKESDEDMAAFYFDLAFCCEQLGQSEEAIAAYNKVLDLDPFNDNAWYNLGTIEVKKGNLVKGQQAYEYAIAINNKNASAYFNLGILCLNLQQYAPARQYFEEFCKLEKDNALGFVGLADACLALEEDNQAEILFRKALILDPDNQAAKDGLKALKDIKKDNQSSDYE